MYMYELFSAFFPILTSFSLKPLTRNHSYIMVYYVFLIRVCDDHSATWHFYFNVNSPLFICSKSADVKTCIRKTTERTPGLLFVLFSHPPKRRRVTYASTIRPASTLSTSSMKPLHGIISYCTCILV